MTYFSAFPCLLGLTILLLQTIFVSKKKQWKMESTKQIRSIRPIRGQKSNPYSLPFREGPGVGFFREGLREAFFKNFFTNLLLFKPLFTTFAKK